MIVLICGSRIWSWMNYAPIEAAIRTLPPGSVVIHGDASGVDTIAGQLATEAGLRVAVFPADWKRYGKRAGPLRNEAMLEVGKPDEVWWFHPDLEASKGTKDMVKRAQEAGVPCYRNGRKEST